MASLPLLTLLNFCWTNELTFKKKEHLRRELNNRNLKPQQVKKVAVLIPPEMLVKKKWTFPPEIDARLKAPGPNRTLNNFLNMMPTHGIGWKDARAAKRKYYLNEGMRNE
jgi:hypothetical protein